MYELDYFTKNVGYLDCVKNDVYNYYGINYYKLGY